MTAPTYNPATDTLVFVADDSQAYYSDLTTMGAAPQGTDPRLMPAGCPAGPIYSATIDPSQTLITGKDGRGKAFSMLYPAGDATKAQDLVLMHPAVPPTDSSLTHYIQFACKFTSTGDGQETFPIKFFRFVLNGHQGGGAPQWSTHDWLPWGGAGKGSTQNPGQTFWEYVNGRGDDGHAYPTGHDQGIQPLGPYWKSSVNTATNDGYWNFVIEFRCHSAALEADGVTKATVALTGDGVSKAGTAVFSSSMAGKLVDGQRVALGSFNGTGVNHGVYFVSAFDGDRTCTLTPLLSGTYALANGTVSGIKYALDFDGCARLYINGTKILDVNQTALDEGTPVGGEKQWCSPDILATIAVDDVPVSSSPLWFGGDHSSIVPTVDVTMTVNLGDGDPTNPDTLAWWTTPYNVAGGQAADHLAITTQPSASTPSGQAHAQQPAGVVQDSSNATVTGDTSTVTATLVLESGTGTARGTTAVQCVAGAFTFAGTGLGVDSAGGCDAHWDLSRPGLPTVSTASFTITPPPVASVPFRSHRAAIL